MPADRQNDSAEKRQDNGAAAESLRKSASVRHALFETLSVIVVPLVVVTVATLLLGRPDMTVLAWGLCAPIALIWVYIRIKELRAARSAIFKAGGAS
jgi:hypothetical protein